MQIRKPGWRTWRRVKCHWKVGSHLRRLRVSDSPSRTPNPYSCALTASKHEGCRSLIFWQQSSHTRAPDRRGEFCWSVLIRRRHNRVSTPYYDGRVRRRRLPSDRRQRNRAGLAALMWGSPCAACMFHGCVFNTVSHISASRGDGSRTTDYDGELTARWQRLCVVFLLSSYALGEGSSLL